MKKTLYVSDLDGTLLNTLDDLHSAVNYTMSALNCPLRKKEEVRSFVGDGIIKLIERALPEEKKSDMGIAYEIFISFYSKHTTEKTRPYPGMVPLLERLKEKGFCLAVVTNKAESVAKQLCEKFFPSIFSAIIGAREGLQKKPSPDGTYEALKILKSTKAESVYVGDSDVDYRTAQNAGLDCVLVTWGFREKSQLQTFNPIAFAENADELEKIFIKDIKYGNKL